MIEIRASSARQAVESGGSPTPSHSIPALTKHEIVQARVIEVLEDRGAIIAIKDRNVIAKSRVALEKDQFLLLRVEQAAPRPLLRVLGLLTRFPAASLMQAVEQNPWRQVLESLGKPTVFSREQILLRDLLNDLSSLLLKPRGREFLREWIEKSGMGFETRLRSLCLQGRQTPEEVNRIVSGNLKGLLSRMVGKQDGAYPLMERLLNVIETLQWFNHGSLDQAGKLFLLLPFQGPEGFWSVAQLLIEKEEQACSKGQRRKPCRMVFLAEFSSLGWVRAEVSVEGKDVRIGFLAGSAESSSTLQEHLPDLIQSLKDQGFRVSEARCGTLEPDLLKQSLVHEVKGAGDLSFSTFA